MLGMAAGAEERRSEDKEKAVAWRVLQVWRDYGAAVGVHCKALLPTSSTMTSEPAMVI
jgi:hypothetical protein